MSQDGIHDLTFRVRPEYSYTSPATGGEVPYQDDQALERMQAVGYRLELYLPPESSAGVCRTVASLLRSDTVLAAPLGLSSIFI